MDGRENGEKMKKREWKRRERGNKTEKVSDVKEKRQEGTRES